MLGVLILIVLGLLLIFWDFVQVWTPNPNVETKGSVVVELNDIPAGEPHIVEVMGKLYSVFRLTEAMARDLDGAENDFCGVPNTAIVESIVVLNLSSTHLGCIVKHHPKGSGGGSDLDAGWIGGYIDPCYGFRFDYLGRQMKDPGNQTACQLDNLSSARFEVEGSRIEVFAR